MIASKLPPPRTEFKLVFQNMMFEFAELFLVAILARNNKKIDKLLLSNSKCFEAKASTSLLMKIMIS